MQQTLRFLQHKIETIQDVSKQNALKTTNE